MEPSLRVNSFTFEPGQVWTLYHAPYGLGACYFLILIIAVDTESIYYHCISEDGLRTDTNKSNRNDIQDLLAFYEWTPQEPEVWSLAIMKGSWHGTT